MPSDGTAPDTVQQAIHAEDLGGLRRALEASAFVRYLGIEFTEFEPGRATAKLPAAPGTANFLGYTHTGALYALAEQVFAAAANSLGYVGLPVSCELHFLKGADPAQEATARGRVVDTQGRIARVTVEVVQGPVEIARLTETVFLRRK